MSEKIELVLHIGAEKTGSSTIQSYLSESVEAYWQDRVMVVDRKLERFSPDAGIMPGPCRMLRDYLESGMSSEPLFDGLKRMHKVASERGARKVIWSAEDLNTFKDEKRHLTLAIIKWLQGMFDVKAVFYVRRQDLWLESSWKQWEIKTGRVSLRDYVERMAKSTTPDFYAISRDWRNILGAEAFRLGVLHTDALESGDLISDFCSKAGVDRKPTTDIPSQNQIFDPDVLEFMHMANKGLFRDRHDNIVFEALYRYKLGVSEGKADRRLLTDQERKQVLGYYKENNDLLIKEFLSDKKEMLRSYFELQGVNSEKPIPGGRNIDKRQILATGLKLAEELYEAVGNDIEANDEYLREVDKLSRLRMSYLALGRRLGDKKMFPFLRTGRIIRALSKISLESRRPEFH